MAKKKPAVEAPGLNGIERVALAKAADKFAGDAGRGIVPGLHMVDFTTTVRVQGVMDKAIDSEVTETLPQKPVLAHALRLAGLSRDLAKNVAEQAMTAAAADKESADPEILARIGDIDTAHSKVAATLPKKPRAGNLTAKLLLTEIQGGGLAAAA